MGTFFLREFRVPCSWNGSFCRSEAISPKLTRPILYLDELESTGVAKTEIAVDSNLEVKAEILPESTEDPVSTENVDSSVKNIGAIANDSDIAVGAPSTLLKADERSQDPSLSADDLPPETEAASKSVEGGAKPENNSESRPTEVSSSSEIAEPNGKDPKVEPGADQTVEAASVSSKASLPEGAEGEGWNEDYVFKCCCNRSSETGLMAACDVCDVWSHNFCNGYGELKDNDAYLCGFCLVAKGDTNCKPICCNGEGKDKEAFLVCRSCQAMVHVSCQGDIRPDMLAAPFVCWNCGEVELDERLDDQKDVGGRSRKNKSTSQGESDRGAKRARLPTQSATSNSGITSGSAEAKDTAKEVPNIFKQSAATYDYLFEKYDVAMMGLTPREARKHVELLRCIEVQEMKQQQQASGQLVGSAAKKSHPSPKGGSKPVDDSSSSHDRGGASRGEKDRDKDRDKEKEKEKDREKERELSPGALAKMEAEKLRVREEKERKDRERREREAAAREARLAREAEKKKAAAEARKLKELEAASQAATKSAKAAAVAMARRNALEHRMSTDSLTPLPVVPGSSRGDQLSPLSFGLTSPSLPNLSATFFAASPGPSLGGQGSNNYPSPGASPLRSPLVPARKGLLSSVLLSSSSRSVSISSLSEGGDAHAHAHAHAHSGMPQSMPTPPQALQLKRKLLSAYQAASKGGSSEGHPPLPSPSVGDSVFGRTMSAPALKGLGNGEVLPAGSVPLSPALDVQTLSLTATATATATAAAKHDHPTQQDPMTIVTSQSANSPPQLERPSLPALSPLKLPADTGTPTKLIDGKSHVSNNGGGSSAESYDPLHDAEY
jgi:hypothetical protein